MIPHSQSQTFLDLAKRFVRQWKISPTQKITAVLIEKLASTNPTTFACMHGSAGAVMGRLYSENCAKI